MGNLCCAGKHSVQFFVQFSYTVKLHSSIWGVWGPLDKANDVIYTGGRTSIVHINPPYPLTYKGNVS